MTSDRATAIQELLAQALFTRDSGQAALNPEKVSELRARLDPFRRVDTIEILARELLKLAYFLRLQEDAEGAQAITGLAEGCLPLLAQAKSGAKITQEVQDFAIVLGTPFRGQDEALTEGPGLKMLELRSKKKMP